MPQHINEDFWNSFWATGKIEHYLSYKGQGSGFINQKFGEDQGMTSPDASTATLPPLLNSES